MKFGESTMNLEAAAALSNQNFGINMSDHESALR